MVVTTMFYPSLFKSLLTTYWSAQELGTHMETSLRLPCTAGLPAAWPVHAPNKQDVQAATRAEQKYQRTSGPHLHQSKREFKKLSKFRGTGWRRRETGMFLLSSSFPSTLEPEAITPGSWKSLSYKNTHSAPPHSLARW